MILVVSAAADSHAQAVLSRLAARGAPGALLDLSSFPVRAALSIDFDGNGSNGAARLLGESGEIDFGACRVVWWRRPQPFGLHPEVSGVDEQGFAFTEAHHAFSGLWLTLDALWINHPTRDEEAAQKVLQLKVARELGLRVPETCITNDPRRAREFIARQGAAGTIYKAFSGTERAWRETRLLKPEELDLLANVRFAPVIFQEYVPAEVDLRVTVVGDRVFPAAIHSQETGYKVDFRMTMERAHFEPAALPPDVEAKLLALVRRFGLAYGAIDLRRTPAGEHVFLEINPAGQWLFVEDRTGQPITDALVDVMVRAEARGEPRS